LFGRRFCCCCRFLELRDYILKRREELAGASTLEPKSAASKGFS
jgi:hypothetical protein